MNTRLMTLEDYSEEKDQEYQELVKVVRGAIQFLRRDPEGCFGGRGNNFGYGYVENLEAQLAWYLSHGYSKVHPWIDMLQAGIDLSVVEKVVANDKGVYIYGTPGNRRIKEINGESVEVNWVYDRKQGAWRGEEPGVEVVSTAEAVAGFHGNTLFEWRGEFHVPRVYI